MKTYTKVHDFEEPVDRLHTDSWKWDYEGEGGRYISMAVADTDFRSPAEIVDRMAEMARFGVYAYGYLPQERFAAAVSGWYAKRYGLTVNPAWIRYANSLMVGAGGLRIVLEAFTRPGDKVLLQKPVYSTFDSVIEGAGRFVASSDLVRSGDGYAIDFDDLDRKLADPLVRIMLVCNPHNPMGSVWSRGDLERIYGLCRAHDVLVVSDEIHGDLLYDGAVHTPFFSISDEAARHVIVMGSPSKTFNLAGLYSAYVVIADERLRERFQAVSDSYHSDFNFLGVEALICAYNECEYYADQERDYIARNIATIEGFFAEHMPEVHVFHPQASHLVWIDCGAWGMAQDELMDFFLGAGVRLNSGEGYGSEGYGCVRMNAGCTHARLQRALDLIWAARQRLLSGAR